MNLQHSLQTIKHDSILGDSIRAGAQRDLNECVRMIIDQARDNYPAMRQIIGSQLLGQVIRYAQKSKL